MFSQMKRKEKKAGAFPKTSDLLCGVYYMIDHTESFFQLLHDNKHKNAQRLMSPRVH